jgi:hypothetical protein
LGIANNGTKDYFLIGRGLVVPSSITNTDFVINNQGNVGIGTTTPSERLNVNGSLRVDNSTGDAMFFVNTTNQRVGIGTSSPGEELEVTGDIKLTGGADRAIIFNDFTMYGDGTGGANKFNIYNTAASNGNFIMDIADGDFYNVLGTAGKKVIYANASLSANRFYSVEKNSLAFSPVFKHNSNTSGYQFDTDQTVTSGNLFEILNQGTEQVVVDSSGNVGINTTTPQNTLNVIGDGNFTGLIYGNGSQLTGIGGASPGGTEGAIQFYDGGNLGGNANQFFINKRKHHCIL